MILALEGFTFNVSSEGEIVRVEDSAGFVDFFNYTAFVYGTSDSDKAAACQAWLAQRVGPSPRRVVVR